jgi:hypothetical protein
MPPSVFQDAPEVVFRQRNHKIQAFPAQHAQQPFADRAGLRTPDRSPEQDSVRRVFHHHHDIEDAEGGPDHHEEITGHNRLGMIVDKGPPTLGRDGLIPTVLQALG